MEPSIEELTELIEKLQAFVDALKNTTTIPREVEQAFRDRFGIDAYSTILNDSKSASSENQAVNEAGVLSYSVLKPPDAFLKTTVNGTVYYIPVYT